MGKYYAVAKGRTVTNKIFKTWEDCKKEVSGVKNAKYKSFKTEKEALNYLKNSDVMNKDVLYSFDGLIAYTDGSYTSSKPNSIGYGAVFLKDDNIIDKISDCANTKYAKYNNIAGEIYAAVYSVKYAIDNGYKKILIIPDYQGIISWVDGSYKANNKLTQTYKKLMDIYAKTINIYFKKVDGHTGQKYNEMADRLAKEGLEKI